MSHYLKAIQIGVAWALLAMWGTGALAQTEVPAEPADTTVDATVVTEETPVDPAVADIEGESTEADAAEATEAEAPAGPSFEKAHNRYMAGQYKSAIKLFDEILTATPDEGPARVGKARAQQAMGRTEAALETLAAPPADNAAWLLMRAELLSSQGDYADAIALANQAYELNTLWAPAVRDYGQLLKKVGRDDDALTVFEQVTDIVADGDYREDAAQLVAIGEILQVYSEMKGLRASEQANNIFNNYFQVAYQDVDRGYWPAHMAAGWFALEKHRIKTASDEFGAALMLNPNIPEAHLGLGVIALSQWNFEGCLAEVKTALATNPNLADAHVLRTMCLLQWRRYDQATDAVAKVLELNPNHIEALSLAAALAVRGGDVELAKTYSDRVAAIDSRCETLPLAIAEWLSAGRQFDEAHGYYQEAVLMAPASASAWTGLGELYMQVGREADAKEAFEKAHEIDDFRADIVNYLGLLDDMELYDVYETEHFIVKVDGDYDAVLLELVAAEAERIYSDVCTDFGHEPEVKTIIEIFPDHMDFSVRLTGRGWLGTVGACTGNVIVLVTPHEERGDFGTYNWANVLRHEFAHTVTLSATDNRIPHWYTEACAVWQQPDRQGFDAVAQLIAAVREDRLFQVKELDWGFVRPKRAGDRSLAYAQSEWILEYIIETQGYDKVTEMLVAFREGKTQTEVFAEVLGTSEHGFDLAFNKWAREQVEAWGFDTIPTDDLDKIATAVRRKPRDASLRATYAAVLYREGEYDKAKAEAEKALALDSRNAKALEVLSLVAMMSKDWDIALGYAQDLLMVDEHSGIAVRVMAAVFIEKRQWPLAVVALEQYQQRRPMDPFSYEQLAGVYTQLGYADKALPNLIELHQRSMTNPEYARRIAAIYNAAGEEALARHYYEQVTNIDPYETGTHEALAAIHRNAKRYGEAIASANRLVLLDDSAENRAKLAMVKFVAGKAEDDLAMVYAGRVEARRSVAMEADGDGGKVLRRIQTYLDENDPEGLLAADGPDEPETPDDEPAPADADDAEATDEGDAQ